MNTLVEMLFIINLYDSKSALLTRWWRGRERGVAGAAHQRGGAVPQRDAAADRHAAQQAARRAAARRLDRGMYMYTTLHDILLINMG